MDQPSPPRAASQPDQIADQLVSLHGLIVALLRSAKAAALPQSVVMGLHWLEQDAASLLADARSAARAAFPDDWDTRGERHLGHQPGD